MRGTDSTTCRASPALRRATFARNRENAPSSTGPLSADGKRIACRNALTHGLTANPAAGAVESAKDFRRLLTAVNDRLQPGDVIEAGLTHRIAVALWRLQRAARIDGALSEQAERRAVPGRDAVQDWIESINRYWRVELVETKVEVEHTGDGPCRGKKRTKHRFIRPALWNLDRFLREEVMASGYAITAMMAMLDSLIAELRSRHSPFTSEAAEQLAWLLGGPAELFPEDDDLAAWFLKDNARTDVQRAIAAAVRRKPGEELPEQLQRLAQARRRMFAQQRLVCEVPYDAAEARITKTVAILPDEATLNRLIRYETHAERSIVRSLETLARLRGAKAETLRASLVHVSSDGTAVAMEGSRQTWSAGRALERRR